MPPCTCGLGLSYTNMQHHIPYPPVCTWQLLRGYSYRIHPCGHKHCCKLFFIVSMIMVVAVVVLYLTIKEPKLEAENQKLEAAHPEWNLATDDGTGHEVLPAPVKRSLSFLLVSISLWFIGYNGVTTG